MDSYKYIFISFISDGHRFASLVHGRMYLFIYQIRFQRTTQ